MDRRTFLRNTGIAVAGTAIVPLNSACVGKSPNDLITIGMIGVGAQDVELIVHALSQSCNERLHGNNGHDADDDAQQGQKRT